MEETQEIKRPTIQERVHARVQQILEPVETWLEKYLDHPDRFNPDAYKLIDLFKSLNVGGVHARKIIEHYEPQYKEFKELLALRKKNLKFKEITDDEDNDSDDRQLLESYDGIVDDEIEKGIRAFDNIFKACDYMISIANANRKPRKKKAVDP